MSRKTIGSSTDNDLVLSHPSIAKRHATAELAEDGSVYVSSAGPAAELWLLNGDLRQRVNRVCLCLGDRLLLGQEEIPLSRLTGLYETTAGVRLRQRQPAPARLRTPPSTAGSKEASAGTASAPRRNPVTGAIEN